MDISLGGVGLVDENAHVKLPLRRHLRFAHGQHDTRVWPFLQCSHHCRHLDVESGGKHLAHLCRHGLFQFEARSELQLRRRAGFQERFKLLARQLALPDLSSSQ